MRKFCWSKQQTISFALEINFKEPTIVDALTYMTGTTTIFILMLAGHEKKVFNPGTW